MQSSHVLKAAVCGRKTVRSQHFLFVLSFPSAPRNCATFGMLDVARQQLAVLSPDLSTATANLLLKAVRTGAFWGCLEHAEPLRHHQTMCYRAAESSSYPAPLTPLSDPAIPISKAATLCRTKLACQNRLSLSFPTIQNESSSKPCFVKKSAEVNVNSIKASVAGLYSLL